MKALPHSAVFGLIAVPPMPAAEDPEHRPVGKAAQGGTPFLAGKTPGTLAAAALLGVVLAAIAALALFASETRAVGQAAAGRSASATAPNAVGP
jgi:hypothetical protein